MNQSVRALYQELKTDALPSLGLPEQGHPEIFRVILEFEGDLSTKPRHFCGASLIYGEGSGILPRPSPLPRKKRGFFLAAAACGGGVHPCTRSVE
jgi:hypothetical protein